MDNSGGQGLTTIKAPLTFQGPLSIILSTKTTEETVNIKRSLEKRSTVKG
jgi:hypothetical protein